MLIHFYIKGDRYGNPWVKSLGASIVDNKNGLCEIVSSKFDVKLIKISEDTTLEAQAAQIAPKKMGTWRVCRKKMSRNDTIYIHTHSSIIHTFHIFWYTILKILNDLPKHIFWESEKNPSQLTQIRHDFLSLRQVETQKVKLHVCSAMSGELLAHIRCLVEFGRAWWNWPAEIMEVLKNTFFFVGFTTLSNNHRRNEWWRERFVFT